MKKLICIILLTTNIFASSYNIYSRESGSGTKSAFENFLNIKRTNIEATISNNTSIMLINVASDKKSIGYVSYSALNNDVKALKVDGKNIKDKNYPLYREFILTTNENNKKPIIDDFLNFIYSDVGSKIIDENYISTSYTNKYASKNLKGSIEISGSSSLAPLIEKLKEEYLKRNKNVKINIQVNDSSTGIEHNLKGINDIGMSSRKLKSSEKLKANIIAYDKLAIIVNKNNKIDNISLIELRNLYKYDK